MNFEELHKKDRERFHERTEERERNTHLETLVEQGEFMRLRDSDEYLDMSAKGRIIYALKAVDTRISQTEKIFAEVAVLDRHGAGVILKDELRPLQFLKDSLGKVFVGKKEPEESTDEVKAVLGIQSSEAEENIIDFLPSKQSRPQTQKKAA